MSSDCPFMKIIFVQLYVSNVEAQGPRCQQERNIIVCLYYLHTLKLKIFFSLKAYESRFLVARTTLLQIYRENVYADLCSNSFSHTQHYSFMQTAFKARKFLYSFNCFCRSCIGDGNYHYPSSFQEDLSKFTQ